MSVLGYHAGGVAAATRRASLSSSEDPGSQQLYAYRSMPASTLAKAINLAVLSVRGSGSAKKIGITAII